MAKALFDSVATEYDGWYLTDLGKLVDDRERELVESLFVPSGPAILEVGCGTGQYSLELAKKGYTLTAVDISANMMAKAKEKLDTNGLKASWLLGDIREVLSRLDVFQGILSVTAFEFIPEPYAVLQELYAHLERGGILVMGMITGKSPWSLAYEEAARQDSKSVFSQARFWTKEEVKGWRLGGNPPEIGEALFFPPNAGTEAFELENRREGLAGFMAAKWVKT